MDLTTIREAEIHQDNGVVSLLKALLEKAERGEILAVCGVTRDRGREFSEFCSPSMKYEFPVQALSYLRVLQMRLERQIPLD